MYIIWFEKDGKWHWVEVFLHETVVIVTHALTAQGYKVANHTFDPKKNSVFRGQGE